MKDKDPKNENKAAAAQGRASACAAAPGAALVMDAALSNTASNKCNSSDLSFVPLRWGVDSLYLSYPGKLADPTTRKLEALKKLAQSDLESDQMAAQYQVGEHLFEVKDKGSGLFSYILRDNAFRISLSRPKSGAVPMAYVQISSGLLSAYSPQLAEAKLGAILEQLGAIQTARVSRLDMYVDFTASVDMESWDRQAWVTRAHQVHAYAVQGHFSGWAIGMGGVIAARLYDKTLEIETSGKEYLKELWLKTGWDGVSPVWRLEFEFKRELLTQKGLSGLSETLDHLGGLWAYATDEWLRLTLPSEEDQTRSRWPVHPLWACLASVDWGKDGGPLLVRFATASAPTERHTLGRLHSSLTTMMALRGWFTLNEAWAGLPSLLDDFLLDRCMFEGAHPDKYVEEQVRLKARRFNLFLNEQATEPPKANAGGYRRQSKGGE